MHGQGADGDLSKVFGLGPEGVIESRPIVFPRNDRGEFHQLRLAETGAQVIKKTVGQFDGRLCHGVGVLQHQTFLFGEHGTGAIIGERFNLLGGDAFLSAGRRPDVNSKRAPDQGGNAQLGEMLKVRGSNVTAGKRLLHLPVTPEDFGVVSDDLNRGNDLAQLALRHEVDEASE